MGWRETELPQSACGTFMTVRTPAIPALVMDPDMPTYGEHGEEAVGSLVSRVAVDAPAVRV